MSLVRYEWNLFDRLHRELERSVDADPVALIPRVESHAEEARYVLRADLPGVAPEDIEITTDQGVMTLKAQRRASAAESASVNYQRRFALPKDADVDQITARSALGVLEISVGKLAKPQPRRITIEAA